MRRRWRAVRAAILDGACAAPLGVGLAVSAALAISPQSAAAQADCAAVMSAACAQRLGAGAIAANDAECRRQWSAYRACIRTLAEQARAAPPSAPAVGACSEARAQSLWADVKEAHDCIDYESFVAACPGAPEARLAEGRMRRLSCGDAAPRPGGDSSATEPSGAVAGGAAIPEFEIPKVIVPSIGRAGGEADHDPLTAQRELRRLGLYDGPLDGVWGPASQTALRAFEAREGIVPVDGELGPTSLAALRAAPTPAAPPPAAAATPAAATPVTFRDCAACPEMAAIPAGAFLMGAPENEPGAARLEQPQREVAVRRFAIGVAAVSFAEWDACVAAGGCGGHQPDDAGWGRGDLPVIYVSWNDAQSYVRWLNGQVAGAPYRLPSEAEWEYAARAGAESAFWMGETIGPDEANFNGSIDDDGRRADGPFRLRTLPVRSFARNPFGLWQVHGNVYEWVEDCAQQNYHDAPTDGSAWRAGDCEAAILRGGSWESRPRDMRSASRARSRRATRNLKTGFRVARDLAATEP